MSISLLGTPRCISAAMSLGIANSSEGANHWRLSYASLAPGDVFARLWFLFTPSDNDILTKLPVEAFRLLSAESSPWRSLALSCVSSPWCIVDNPSESRWVHLISPSSALYPQTVYSFQSPPD